MNSTNFILSLTKLCIKLEEEFPNKKGSIDSVRTHIYEIIENLLPVRYDYRGKRVKIKVNDKDNGWETVLEALINANESLDKKDYEKLTDHLINIEANLLDVTMSVRTARKNLLKIVDEINKIYFSNDK